MRFFLLLVVVLVLESGHPECWSVECCANSELHPRSRLGDAERRYSAADLK
jgi:hypothetical protein